MIIHHTWSQANWARRNTGNHFTRTLYPTSPGSDARGASTVTETETGTPTEEPKRKKKKKTKKERENVTKIMTAMKMEVKMETTTTTATPVHPGSRNTTPPKRS
ncbi:S-adenosylmethionine-dependent methyltransferase [Histoplasma capsulatum var. duboisii H88]|uniref:S-adenosylmethionine-dependent methyltransferase n=1 Tax=Ajellomyces capsulatus (strain H88) TaxID=544711 RepID=A0A8A1LIJ9_AJEC8|nr:S-adenosylmethionine-dependent methyltransferase [Histoplasma capsulatum var. duboisii H88]